MNHNFEIRLKRVICVASGKFGTRIESFCWANATGTYAKEAAAFAESRLPGWTAIDWIIK